MIDNYNGLHTCAQIRSGDTCSAFTCKQCYKAPPLQRLPILLPIARRLIDSIGKCSGGQLHDSVPSRRT